MLFFYIGNNETKQYSPNIVLFYYHKATYFMLKKKTKNNDARDQKINGVISSTDQLLTPRRGSKSVLRKKYWSYRKKNFFWKY